jgi:uncharacterized protein YjbK
MRTVHVRTFARRTLVLVAALSLCPSLRGEGECPVEVKLLLSPAAIHKVIESLGSKNERRGRVYFYDTDALDLLRQGVIVRIRQGANDDLTVKVRIPEGSENTSAIALREHFACEIDRNGSGENTSYSIRRKYKVRQVAEKGSDLAGLLNSVQKNLLQSAGVSIDWSRVTKIASIESTTWEATSQSHFRKLAVELWKWPSGTILEVSAKVGPGEGPSEYEELQRLVKGKGVPLSASQVTKTRTVLETTSGQVPD